MATHSSTLAWKIPWTEEPGHSDRFSQHHLLKSLSLPHCILLPSLSKIKYPKVHGFISGLPILFHWSVCLFVCFFLYVCFCASIVLS